METTFETSRNASETVAAPVISTEGTISRKALITFLSGALIVFSLAVYYCMTTDHVFEGTVLIGAFGLITVFAASVYKSFK